MKQKLITIYFIVLAISIQAQTFTNSTGYSIPSSTSTCIPVTVSGVGTLSDAYGLEQVCIDLSISATYDMYISLKAPDGTEYYMYYHDGFVAGSDYSVTCFNSNSSNPIWIGSPPYNGTYQPETNLGVYNNGMDADGTWYVCFDNDGSYTGTLSEVSITFSNSPSTACGALATDDCSASPLICDFDGYCGTTSAAYTVATGEDASISGCGYSLNNNSWIQFVAGGTSVTIDVVVEDCEHDADGDPTTTPGVQFGVWESSNCSSFTNIDCGPSNPLFGSHSMTFSGLTAGTTYYLMIDGYAGDVCNYTFSVDGSSGVSVVEIDQGDTMAACVGDDVTLSAPSLPGVSYEWNWGSSTDTGSSITISNINPPLNVSLVSSGVCNNNTDQISITLESDCCSANAGNWE